jgi:hypothetical protein
LSEVIKRSFLSLSRSDLLLRTFRPTVGWGGRASWRLGRLKQTSYTHRVPGAGWRLERLK